MELSDSQPAFPRRFFVALAVAALSVVAMVAGTVLRAEQVGGSSLTDTFVDNARFGGGVTERTLKVDLLAEQEDLDFVLLGNSRVQRWDPTRITDETGARGFNAGLVGLPIRDERVLVEWIARRAQVRDEQMPHLVYVLPFESFHEQPRGATTLDLPGATPNMTFTERVVAASDRARRLVQWQTLRRAIRVLRDGPPDTAVRPEANEVPPVPIQPRPEGLPETAPDPDAPGVTAAPPATIGSPATPAPPAAPATPGDASSESGVDADEDTDDLGDPPFGAPDDTAAPDERFRADGYLPTGAFFSSSRFGDTKSLRAFVSGQHRQFYDDVTRRGGPGRIEPSAKRELERLLAAANRAGDAPTLVLAPIEPDFATELSKLGRDEFADTLRAWLVELADEYDFQVLDYSDPYDFGDAADSFYDGVHPGPEIADAMTDRLVEDDPLLRGDR